MTLIRLEHYMVITRGQKQVVSDLLQR